jgi:hypothetical protein
LLSTRNSSAPTMSQTGANHSSITALFSDYYLTTRLPDTAEWKSAGDAGAMIRAFRKLRELYAGVRETFSNQPEEAVRARLLEPVLTTLGFAAQPVKASNNGTAEPGGCAATLELICS